MPIPDVIDILLEYCQDGQETFRQRRGAEAVVVVRDIIDLLRGALGAQLDFDALWADFQAAPRQTAPELSGALEALVEADPGFADKLDAGLREFYATGRPDAPAPAEPEPVEPAKPSVEEAQQQPRRHTDDAGEGAYLYGNVPGGTADVGERPDLEPDILDVHRRLDALSFDVRALFDQLHTTIREGLSLDDDIRLILAAQLDQLQAQLALGEDADEDRVVHHLRRIGQIEPDLLDLVLIGLRHTQGEAHGVVQGAIRRVAGPDDDEA